MISFFELLSGERFFSPLLKTLSDWQFWFEGLERGREGEEDYLLLAAYQTYLYLSDRRSLVRDYDSSAQPRMWCGLITMIDSCLWEKADSDGTSGHRSSVPTLPPGRPQIRLAALALINICHDALFLLYNGVIQHWSYKHSTVGSLLCHQRNY